MRHFRPFQLLDIIGINVIACAACTFVLPICVGPVDVSNTKRQPSVAGVEVESAVSPAHTFACAEITPPKNGFPGCLVGEITNHSDSAMRNATLRYYPDHSIIVNRYALGRRVTVDGASIAMRFPNLPPHATDSIAIDFRLPGETGPAKSALETFVPLQKGVLIAANR